MSGRVSPYLATAAAGYTCLSVAGGLLLGFSVDWARADTTGDETAELQYHVHMGFFTQCVNGICQEIPEKSSDSLASCVFHFAGIAISMILLLYFMGAYDETKPIPMKFCGKGLVIKGAATLGAAIIYLVSLSKYIFIMADGSTISVQMSLANIAALLFGAFDLMVGFTLNGIAQVL